MTKLKENELTFKMNIERNITKDQKGKLELINPKLIFLSFIPFKDSKEANHTIAQKIQLTSEDLEKGFIKKDFKIPYAKLQDCEVFRGWREESLKGEIVEIYFSYGKEQVRLQESSKHSQDINLHIKTKNCENGEELEIIIETADNQSFIVCAIIHNNVAVIENVFKDKHITAGEMIVYA